MAGRKAVRVITDLLGSLSTDELRQAHDLIEEEYESRVESNLKIALESMGIDRKKIKIMINRDRKIRKDVGAKRPVKYRSPTGQTWTGVGSLPQWLAVLENHGHSREEFLVEE